MKLMSRPVNQKILDKFKLDNRQQLPLVLPIKHVNRGYPIVDKNKLEPGTTQLVSVTINSSFRKVNDESRLWSVMGKFEKGGLVKVIFEKEAHKNRIERQKGKLIHFLAKVSKGKNGRILTFQEEIMDYEFGRLVPYYSRSKSSHQDVIRREIADRKSVV